MKAQQNNSEGLDFTVIFDEIDRHNSNDYQLFDNIKTVEEIDRDNSIKEFGKICMEISDMSNPPVIYTTFS